MPTDPLRDLCPRAVVVWRLDAARCSTCGRMVNRATAGHPWRHARIVEAYIESELERLLRERIVDELDRLIDPAEPTHPLELKVLGRKPVVELELRLKPGVTDLEVATAYRNAYGRPLPTIVPTDGGLDPVLAPFYDVVDVATGAVVSAVRWTRELEVDPEATLAAGAIVRRPPLEPRTWLTIEHADGTARTTITDTEEL
jgi:hypothetical protein